MAKKPRSHVRIPICRTWAVGHFRNGKENWVELTFAKTRGTGTKGIEKKKSLKKEKNSTPVPSRAWSIPLWYICYIDNPTSACAGTIDKVQHSFPKSAIWSKSFILWLPEEVRRCLTKWNIALFIVCIQMEPNQQYYFHMVTFIRLYKVDLTSRASKNNVLWWYHLHEASLTIRLHGIYYLAISYRTNSCVWLFLGG